MSLSCATAAAAAVCYVDGAAGGADTGASWTDAYTDLQSALADAGCAEIWVAQGAYKPSAGDQSASFNIAPGVAVYGGFSGDESSRDARDPAAHVTILSGDIDDNDNGTNGVDADASQIVGSNSRHIVVLDGTINPITATSVLDGFTLTGGSNNTGNGGGALLCKGNGSGHECSPTLARLVFSGNRSTNNGGAVELDGYSGGASNPTLTDIVFTGNSAANFGGAMYNNAQLSGGTSSPTLTNVTFTGNSSGLYGGAMFNDGSSSATSSPTLSNVTFSGNQATGNGGALYNLAGVTGASSPRLTNVTFSGNHAGGDGGAMYNNGFNSSPTIINTTFNGNSAANGGAIYAAGAFGSVLLNSILWGDSATTNGPEFVSTGSIDFYYSIVAGGCNPGTQACNGSPIYTDDPKLGALADNGGSTQTLMPGSGSAAIDMVPCSYASEAPTSDQRGAVRPDSASSGSTRCDIGAVEANSLPGDLVFADRFGSSPWDDF